MNDLILYTTEDGRSHDSVAWGPEHGLADAVGDGGTLRRHQTEYFLKNPVKAGLCQTAEAWPWSSAFPGNADVPVGTTSPQADEDVGAPRSFP